MNYQYEYDWIKKWAEYTPNKIVFRDYNLQKTWTYYEFNQRTEALSYHLVNQLNIKKGDRLAFYAENRVEHVFLFFACVKTGAIFVPLNYRLSPPEMDTVLKNAEPSLLFYDKHFNDNVEQLSFAKNIPNILDISYLNGYLFDAVDPQTLELDYTISEDDLVLILYTSGTTGIPKGVTINHRMLFWNSINTELRLDLNSFDHTQNFAPFFHTGGWNVLLTPFIHHGASVTLLDGFDADLILKLFEQEKTTIFFGVPTMLQMMADSQLFDEVDISSIRYVVVGGAPMPIPLINKWHKKGVYIRQGYGLTEVGPNCFSLHQNDAVIKKGSIGFPNFYIKAKIVNENNVECPPEVKGELCLKSKVVSPGYWNNPVKTKEAVKDGWFYTGDMAMKDKDGYYYIVDRKKNMYISGGENVYPAEVEKVLLKHKAVKEAAVIGVPDNKWGEVGKGFVVMEKNCHVKEDELISFCMDKLAKYKIPKSFQFIEKLPRNDAGKLDRKKLKGFI